LAQGQKPPQATPSYSDYLKQKATEENSSYLDRVKGGNFQLRQQATPWKQLGYEDEIEYETAKNWASSQRSPKDIPNRTQWETIREKINNLSELRAQAAAKIKQEEYFREKQKNATAADVRLQNASVQVHGRKLEWNTIEGNLNTAIDRQRSLADSALATLSTDVKDFVENFNDSNFASWPNQGHIQKLKDRVELFVVNPLTPFYKKRYFIDEKTLQYLDMFLRKLIPSDNRAEAERISQDAYAQPKRGSSDERMVAGDNGMTFFIKNQSDSGNSKSDDSDW
jgi:hypothetical protein